MKHLDDILLLSLIKHGDQVAFKHLFYEYVDALERFIMYYIHDREKSQELVLDIFTYIWEHRETFEIRLTLKAYLFQSAKNKALSYIRDKKDVVYIDDISNLEFREVENHKLEMEELQALIQEAVSLLPSKCKEIYKKVGKIICLIKKLLHCLIFQKKQWKGK